MTQAISQQATRARPRGLLNTRPLYPLNENSLRGKALPISRAASAPYPRAMLIPSPNSGSEPTASPTSKTAAPTWDSPAKPADWVPPDLIVLQVKPDAPHLPDKRFPQPWTLSIGKQVCVINAPASHGFSFDLAGEIPDIAGNVLRDGEKIKKCSPSGWVEGRLGVMISSALAV